MTRISMQELLDLPHAPWNAGTWDQKTESLDGTAVDLAAVVPENVAEVVAYGTTQESSWDGLMAMVLRLRDGRFVSWEAWWESSGSAFAQEYYGGDALVWFSADVPTAVSRMAENALDLIRDQLREDVRYWMPEGGS